MLQLNRVLKVLAAATALAGLTLISAPKANAQFGGGGMPPEIQKKINAWKKFGEAHKKLTSLGDLLYQLGDITKDPGYAPNKTQSKKILAILNANKSKTSLSEDQAGTIAKGLTSSLTLKQIKKMATIETPTQKARKSFGGGGGGGRPGGGATGGGRPGGGAGSGFKFPDPPAKGWNPINPDSMPESPFKPAAKTRMTALVGELSKSSH